MSTMAFVHTGEFDDGYLFYDIYKNAIKELTDIENIEAKEIKNYCNENNPSIGQCDCIGWAMRDKKDESKIKLYFRWIGNKALWCIECEEKKE